MDAFRMCGWPAFMMLFVALIALVTGVLALVLGGMKQPRVGLPVAIVSLVLALGVFAGGQLAAMYGRTIVDDALASGLVEASQEQLIRQAGYEEAGMCVKLGLSFGSLPFVLAIVALALSITALREQRASGPRPG